MLILRLFYVPFALFARLSNNFVVVQLVGVESNAVYDELGLGVLDGLYQ